MDRLVQFSHVREAPEHILERLRSIDSTAELLWWGPRLGDVPIAPGKVVPIVFPVWLLGTVRPNGLRRKVGIRLLRTQEMLGPKGDRDNWRYANLLYQNFAPIAFYPFREAGSAIVEDFRLRDWMLRNQVNEEEQRFLLEAEGIPALELRKATMLDKAQSEGPSIWRFAYKNQHSVTVN